MGRLVYSDFPDFTVAELQDIEAGNWSRLKGALERIKGLHGTHGREYDRGYSDGYNDGRGDGAAPDAD